ncbi:lytic transglycosylase domain-containing protein [Kiritimatiellota bacterium B12222]|nr:lytic transglycosylase domain-containing protein [Kiritimatiellota bacterium B12222]
MNPKHWHHDPAQENHPSPWITVVSVGIGTLLGISILWWIIKPLWLPPAPPPSLPTLRGIVISGEDQLQDGIDLEQATELLIDAIIQIESQGNPQMVGSVGERGLMQIRESTWKEVTQKHMGGAIPFSRAFEPELNRKVGRYYLGDLQVFLYKNHQEWSSDLRSLLLACYNAGPESVRNKGFNIKHMPKTVQSYANRGSALHDWYLRGDTGDFHQILIQAAEREPQEP